MRGVGVAARDGRVDVTHDAVARGHGCGRQRLVEGLGELFLLLAVLGASVLEPHLEHGEDRTDVGDWL